MSHIEIYKGMRQSIMTLKPGQKLVLALNDAEREKKVNAARCYVGQARKAYADRAYKTRTEKIGGFLYVFCYAKEN